MYDVRFDIVMERLSQKDLKYLDSQIDSVKKSIDQSKTYIIKFQQKMKVLDSFLKDHKDTIEFDNPYNTDLEKASRLADDMMDDLDSAKFILDSIYKNMIPEMSKFRSRLDTAAIVGSVLSFILLCIGGMKSSTKVGSMGIVGLGVSQLGFKAADRDDYIRKWKDKISEYKSKENPSFWETIDLLKDQIKDLETLAKKKYPRVLFK